MTSPRHLAAGLRRRRGPLLAMAAALALLATLLGVIGTPNAADRGVGTVPFGELSPKVLGGVAALSDLGAPLVSMILTAAACTTLLFLRRRFAAGILVAATSGAAVLYLLLKRLFALPRPDDALVAASGYGFPSGHTLVSTVMWGYLAWILVSRARPAPWRRVAVVVCLALAVCIGLTRIVLQVHWLTDVVGGWLYGLAWLASVLWIELRRLPAPDLERSAPPG